MGGIRYLSRGRERRGLFTDRLDFRRKESLHARTSRADGARERSSGGVTEADMYDAVRLTIQGRTCTMDVMEVPDGLLALIGQLPLAHLDLVIDLRNQRLIGNPAHGGEHMYELY